jgi:hypothetical protein
MMPLLFREAKSFLGHSAWLVVGLATVMCAAREPVRCLDEPPTANRLTPLQCEEVG